MLAILLLIALPLQEADAARTTVKTKIDGKTYRVTRKGAAVEVAGKAMFVSRSLDERDRMRRAITDVTGCSIRDELWQDNGWLQGRLECPADKQ